MATKEPGVLSDVHDRISAAAGWVAAASLRGEDTSELLPPGDAIVGTRVWGPLREGQQLWELGMVTKADGDKVTVERYSDRGSIELERGTIRFGSLAAGTKVLTFCSGAVIPQPAIIEEVGFPKSGDPIATVTCLDASGSRTSEKKRELLGTLRGKPDWLPARK